MLSFPPAKIFVFLGVALTHASLIGALSCLENSPLPQENAFIFLELIEPLKPETPPEPEIVEPEQPDLAADAAAEVTAEAEEIAIAALPPPLPEEPQAHYEVEAAHDSASGNDGVVRGDDPAAGEQIAEETPKAEVPLSAPANPETALPAKKNTAEKLGKQGEQTATREGAFGAGGSGGNSVTASVRYLHRVAPKYPRADKIAGRTGTVILILEINAAGKLTDVRIKQSSGSRSLDAAAIRAARASKYLPAHDGERAVPSRAEASYTFSR